MSGKPIATIGSNHSCPMCSGIVPHVGGPIIGPGAPNVLINGKPVALMGDMCACAGGPDSIAQGDSFVKVNGVPVATLGSMTVHGGVVVTGEPNVLICPNVPEPQLIMAKEKLRFPNINFINKVQATLVGHSLTEAEENIKKLKELAEETKVPEDSEVELKSTIAEDVFFKLAKENCFEYFFSFMTDIFGMDIPTGAYKKIYTAGSTESLELVPLIKVKKTIPEGGAACFYSNVNKDIQEIWVGEDFVIRATENNDTCGELMVVLIEEYGHWLDYLLRNVYADTEEKDALRDEGAYFSYKMLQIQSIDKSDQEYGEAKVKGVAHSLIWDYEPFHKALKDYVSKERWEKNDVSGDLEFYKAGFFGGEKKGKYGHGDVEREVFEALIEGNKYKIEDKLDYYDIDKDDLLLKIYYGNWKRDYSQMLDPQMIRIASNVIITLINNNKDKSPEHEEEVIEILSRYKDFFLSYTPTKEERTVELKIPYRNKDLLQETLEVKLDIVKVLTNLICRYLELSAGKEFVYHPLEEKINKIEVQKKKLHFWNYTEIKALDAERSEIIKKMGPKDCLETLKKEFSVLNIETMGVYNLAEHIDNPKGVGIPGMVKFKNGDYKKQDNKDREIIPNFMGDSLDADHKSNVIDKDLHQINRNFGMKNYIRRDKIGPRPELNRYKYSYDYMIYKLKDASKIGGYKNKFRQDNLGCALHTLEDFFAHSNFVELALIKAGFVEVFPWVGYLGYGKDVTITKKEPSKDKKEEASKDKKIDSVRELGSPVFTAFDYYSEIQGTKKEKQFLKNTKTSVVLGEVKGINDFNKIVTRIPLVTGTFDEADTIASVLPIINKAFYLDSKITKKKKKKEKLKSEVERKQEIFYEFYKERSFNHVMIKELLKAVLIGPLEVNGEGITEDHPFFDALDLVFTVRNMEKVSSVKIPNIDFKELIKELIPESLQLEFYFKRGAYYLVCGVIKVLNEKLQKKLEYKKNIDQLEKQGKKIQESLEEIYKEEKIPEFVTINIGNGASYKSKEFKINLKNIMTNPLYLFNETYSLEYFLLEYIKDNHSWAFVLATFKEQEIKNKQIKNRNILFKETLYEETLYIEFFNTTTRIDKIKYDNSQDRQSRNLTPVVGNSLYVLKRLYKNTKKIEKLKNLYFEKKVLLKKIHTSLLEGYNPSHTQVAKDDDHHCMHGLSVELAKEAIKKVVSPVFGIWTSDGGVKFQDVEKALGEILRHPAQTDWHEKIVTDWARKYDNLVKLKEATNLSAVLNSLHHFEEELESSSKVIGQFAKKFGFDKMAKHLDKLLNDKNKPKDPNFVDLMTTLNNNLKDYKASIKLLKKHFESMYPQQPYTTKIVHDRLSKVGYFK